MASLSDFFRIRNFILISYTLFFVFCSENLFFFVSSEKRVRRIKEIADDKTQFNYLLQLSRQMVKEIMQEDEIL